MAKKPSEQQRADVKRVGRGGTGKLDATRRGAKREPGQPGLVIGPTEGGPDVEVVPRRLAGVRSRGRQAS